MGGIVQDGIFFEINTNMPTLKCSFGCESPYADLIEVGSADLNARPFLEPAIYENGPEFANAIKWGYSEALVDT